MGRSVCEAVSAAPDMTLAAVLDRTLADGHLPEEARAAAPAAGTGVEVLAGCDVVVDFTVAAAARSTLPWLAEHGIHAVVGTTGLGADDLALLERAFDGTRANALIAPNFALGAVLLMRFCELAAPLMDSVEVIELHHDQKRDAPSGTAIETARRIAAARDAAGCGPLPPDPTVDMVLASARGAEGPGAVHVHSVRLPGLVAHEEVIFGTLGQSLTLRHDSYDRRSFMPGVLLAVRRVGDHPGLTVGLESLLDL
jgi:4-hydroxy-tetrahydrodipicolinate reductase